MAREDWTGCRIPVLMGQAIDKFLTTDIAHKNGITSRSDFATRVIGSWFAQYEKEFGLFVPREVRRNLKGFDLMRPSD